MLISWLSNGVSDNFSCHQLGSCIRRWRSWASKSAMWCCTLISNHSSLWVSESGPISSSASPSPIPRGWGCWFLHDRASFYDGRDARVATRCAEYAISQPLILQFRVLRVSVAAYSFLIDFGGRADLLIICCTYTGRCYVFVELHIDHGRLDWMGLPEVERAPSALQRNDPRSSWLPHVAPLWKGIVIYDHFFFPRSLLNKLCDHWFSLF